MLEQASLNNQNASQLRTFRGWKRNTGHLDKSRTPKGVWQPHVTFPPCEFSSFKRVIV